MTGLTPVSFRTGRGAEPRLTERYVPGRLSDRFWTDTELDVLKRHFEGGGAAACRVHLPHRSTTAIYLQARRLGLQSDKMHGGPRQRHDYGPDIEARIREAWPDLKGRGAVQALADRLEVPRWWLSKQATLLGLSTPHCKEPVWTEAECALMHKMPLHDPQRCAAIFREHGYHRTPTAIVVRANRMDLSRRTRETLSATAAAKILGVDNKTLSTWCISGDLKASRGGTKRLTQQGGDIWAIQPADLRAFILDQLARIDIRKVDKFAFVALLTEPSSEPCDEAVPPGQGAASDGQPEVSAELCTQIADLQQENLALRQGVGRALAPATPVRRVRRWVRSVAQATGRARS